jgi:hypothetical protein
VRGEFISHEHFYILIIFITKLNFIPGYPVSLYICRKFKVNLSLCSIKYHAISTCFELSLKQTKRLQIWFTNTDKDGEFVGWTVSCMNSGILYTVRDSDLSLRKIFKKKEPASSSNCTVHDTNTQKNFTRYLPTMLDKCFLKLAVTTDVYKQHTSTCPLHPAATIRHVLLANSVIHFI